MKNNRYQSRAIRSTKEGFGEGLLAAARRHPGIIGLGSDITSSVGMNYFAEAFPERFFSLGIAEQNCVGVAAGLALEGFLPVFANYGVFAALRGADQIRISLCYNNLHVIIGGAHAGISVGPDGATHQALEDIAIMRVLPNMMVFSPCDATQTAQAVEVAVDRGLGPVYIRYGRNPVPDFTDPGMLFDPCKGQILHEGDDICFIATGHMVWESLQAAYALETTGISCRVVNIHTISPIDNHLILECADTFPVIFTVEEHQISGGLGGAVAEVAAEAGMPCRIVRLGMPNCFGESGQPVELLEKYWLTAAQLIRTVQYQLNDD